MCGPCLLVEYIRKGLRLTGLPRLVLTTDSLTDSIYGRKSVDRIATRSMSSICNLWHLIVGYCDYAER